MPVGTEYGLTEFGRDLREILQADGSAGLPRVAEKLQLLLANERFVAETFDAAMPPSKRVLLHDGETDAYVLAHVHPPSAQPGPPHSHGTSWAVYGNARGNTEMTIWRRVNPESDAHAELSAVDTYLLREGQARPYPPGTIHSTNQPAKAWVIRVTGTDLDTLPRFRFDRKIDKIVDPATR